MWYLSNADVASFQLPDRTADGAMWNLILYVIAVIVGLILIWVYEPKEEKPFDEEAEPLPRRKRYKSVDNWRMSSVFAVLGLDLQEDTHFESFTEHFHSFGEVGNACKRAGLESSNLIIGVDFTASNEWQGRKSFNQNCLHRIVGNKVRCQKQMQSLKITNCHDASFVTTGGTWGYPHDRLCVSKDRW